METQYLQYFAAVAKHLNFNRAAEDCHVSQPALSAQIKKFEESLGCQLFYRSKRHVQLTPEGQKILPRAIAILAEMRCVKELATQLRDPLSGRIRIGFSSAISFSRAFSAVVRVRSKYPKMDIHFEEDSSNSLIDRLFLGDFDLVILQHFSRVESPSVRYRIFEKAQLVHIVAKDKRLKGSSETYITTRATCPLGQLMDEAAESTGFPTQSRFFTNEISVIKRMVEVGAGWSVVPESSLTNSNRNLFTVTPVKGFSVDYVIVVNQGARSEAILDAFFKEASRQNTAVLALSERPKTCLNRTQFKKLAERCAGI